MSPTTRADRCITLPTGKKCLPTPYRYLFQTVIASALGVLPNQVQSMDTDGDFWLHSIVAIGANYTFRFQNADKAYLSNDYIPCQFYQTSPTPAGGVLGDPVFFPAGSPITIDLTDTSNLANNAVKIIFSGTKMLYM